MSFLRFSFHEALEELNLIAALASSFLEPTSRDRVLPTFRGQLENIRTEASNADRKWEIPDDDPLRTKISRGKYEPGATSGREAIAVISCLWEVRRIPPTKKSRPAEEFQLTGIASTHIRLFERNRISGLEELLVSWKMEIGDDQSPGCHFHIQFPEGPIGSETRPIPVPRLPSLLFSPAAVLEFALGELFQDEWRREMLRSTYHVGRWRPIQERRLVSILNWHLEKIREEGSPWMGIKAGKPRADLFVSS
jgi:hypothetical protein